MVYSFKKQIGVMKGRKQRVNYYQKSDLKTFQQQRKWRFTDGVVEREEYAKFLKPNLS